MRQSETKIDFSLIDDLVCGNLHGEDYRRAVQALDREPERWRDCAIAFLQEQALSQELKTLTRQAVCWDQSEAHVEHQRQTVAVEDSMTDGQVTQVASSGGIHFTRLQTMHRFTNLAALLLISFTIGWFGAGFQRGYQRSPERIANSGHGSLGGRAQQNPALQSPTPQNPAQSRQVSPSEFPTTISSPEAGLFFSGDDLGLADASLMPIDRNMPDWLRSYERAGRVRIDSYEALMPMDFEDGTSALVPVQQYRVKPVVYSY